MHPATGPQGQQPGGRPGGAPELGPTAGQAGADPVLVEIRANGGTYGRGVATRGAVMLPLIFIGFYRGGQSDLPAGVRWGIVGAGVVIGLIAIAMMTVRVQLTWSSVKAKRLIGVEKVIPRQQMSYGILVQQYQQFANMAAPLLVLVDANRRKLMYLSGQLFSAPDMYSLAQAIGIQFFDVIRQPVNAKMIDRRHPKVLSVWERRPFLIAFGVVIVIIVLVVVVVVGTDSTS